MTKTFNVEEQEIKISSEEESVIELPLEDEYFISTLQLEISCGFNMYNKNLAIKFLGEKEHLVFPVHLSQMYKLKIDLKHVEVESDWKVKKILIRGFDKENHNVNISVNARMKLAEQLS